MKKVDIVHNWCVKELDTNYIIYVGFSLKECEDYLKFLIENGSYKIFPGFYITTLEN